MRLTEEKPSVYYKSQHVMPVSVPEFLFLKQCISEV